MDFQGFVRRFSQSAPNSSTEGFLAENNTTVRNRPQGLTVDTNVLKEYRSKVKTFESTRKDIEPQWSSNNNNDSEHSSRAPTPTSTRNEDIERHNSMRRRRSSSECLLLAKTRGGQDLPGPCQEYISSVKQILAKSEDSRPEYQRRRSMSMRNNPPVFQ